MVMTVKTISGGDIIAAPPTMQDLRFRRTSVLITYHDLDGSLGLCLNRPTRNTLEQISKEIGLDRELNFPLYWGGPVNPGTIWMVHSPEWSLENTIKVNDEWSITSNEKMFWALQDGDIPQYFRFFHGFCSWQSEQLDLELRGEPPWDHKSSWLIVEQPDAETLLEMPPEEIWQHCVELSGQQAVSSWL